VKRALALFAAVIAGTASITVAAAPSASAASAAGTAPGSPGNVATRTASDGVAVTWTPPTDTGGSTIVGYDVLRGTTPDALTQVGFATATGAPSYADRIGNSTTAATTYYYAIEAVNETDTGPQTAPLAGTTPTTVFVPSTHEKFTLEGSHTSAVAPDGDYLFASTAANPTAVAATWNDPGISVRGQGLASFSLYGATAPGTYAVDAATIPTPTAALCWSATNTCEQTGTVVVNQVDIDSANTLVGFSADVTMNGGAVASIRYGTDDALTAVSLPAVDAGATTVGGTRTPTATYTNVGDTATTIGTVSVVPSDGSATTDWSTTGNDTCTGAVIDPGNSCTVGLSVTPTAVGANTGELVVTDNSPAGTHERALTVLAKTAPPAPSYLTATRAADGTVTLQWSDLGGQTASSDSFTISEGSAPDNLQPIATQPANTNNTNAYTDPDTASDGVRYYAVTGTNIAGTGTPATLTVDASLHPPSGVKVGPVIDGGVVSWTAPAGYPAGTVTYDVYAGASPATLTKVDTTTATNAPLTGLKSGSTYDVAVLAHTANGETSALSQPVAFTPSSSELLVTTGNGRPDFGRASLAPGTPGYAPFGSLAGANFAAAVAAPNGLHVAYTTASLDRPTTYGVWVANRDGSGAEQLASGTSPYGAPTWTQDGTALAYPVNGALHVSPVTAATATAGWPSGTSWIGPHDIVRSGSTPTSPLVVYDTSNGAQRTIPNSAGGGFPSPNPAGDAVAYTAGGYTWVTTLAGMRHEVALPLNSSGAMSIAWSRDESRLYVVTNNQVWSTLAGGGGTPVQITSFSPYVPTSVSVVAPDSAPPGVSVAKLPAIATTAAVTLSYSARDAVNRVRSYDVQYTHATTVWVNPAWPVTHGWGTTATSLPVHLIGGIKYCFYVRATDDAGNVSAWSKPVCTTAPLDDRAMHKTAGFAAVTGSAFYLGTAYSTTHYGEAAWTTTSTRALYLVATTCPTCGSVEILEGNKPVGVINLHSATTVYKRVLAIPNTRDRVDFMIRVVSSGKRVVIDGVVFQPK
jgi:hypothetical protein